MRFGGAEHAFSRDDELHGANKYEAAGVDRSWCTFQLYTITENRLIFTSSTLQLHRHMSIMSLPSQAQDVTTATPKAGQDNEHLVISDDPEHVGHFNPCLFLTAVLLIHCTIPAFVTFTHSQPT